MIILKEIAHLLETHATRHGIAKDMLVLKVAPVMMVTIYPLMIRKLVSDLHHALKLIALISALIAEMLDINASVHQDIYCLKIRKIVEEMTQLRRRF